MSHVNLDAAKPDAVKPDGVIPDAVDPDAAKPDAVKPDGVIPDAVDPDADNPDAVNPDTKTNEEIRILLEKQIKKNTLTLPDNFYKKVIADLLDKIDRYEFRSLKTFITTNTEKGKQLDTISHEEIRVLINEYLLTLFPTKRANAILKLYTFTQEDIAKMFLRCDDKYKLINKIDTISFTVFGCKESTDIDVAVVVNTNKLFGGQFQNLSDDAIKYIISRLNVIGYDTITRKVDTVTICVDDGNIIGVSKGGKELANVIAATRDYHRQDKTLKQVPINTITFTYEIRNTKSIAYAKFLLVNLCSIFRGADYKNEETRDIKESTLGDKTRIFDTMTNPSVIDKIIFDPVTATENRLNLTEFHNTWKSIIMKLLQIIQIHFSDKTCYHKEELANEIRNMRCFDFGVDDARIDEFVQGALWYLFRGTRGAFCPTLFTTLHDIYCRIFKDMLDDSKLNSYWVYINMGEYDNRIISDESFRAFVDSPIIVTEAFTRAWKAKYGDTSISKIFMMGFTTKESFIEELRKLKTSEENISSLIACLWFIQQRSAEWLDILSSGKLICGKNSTPVSGDEQSQYNLIRGALTELIIINLLSNKQSCPNTQKLIDEIRHIIGKDDIRHIIGTDDIFCLSVGFIGNKVNGCKGCAPDLIIFCKDKIIPVEIKTLKTSDDNSDRRRAISLAKKQNIRTREILVENDVNIKIEYSFIILCSWCHGILNVEIIKQNM